MKFAFLLTFAALYAVGLVLICATMGALVALTSALIGFSP